MFLCACIKSPVFTLNGIQEGREGNSEPELTKHTILLSKSRFHVSTKTPSCTFIDIYFLKNVLEQLKCGGCENSCVKLKN